MARTLLLGLFTTALTALAMAAPASAVPDCTDTGPTTRTCVTPGHTAITTTPNPALNNPFAGWGWGTPVFGLGGGGIWIGF
jgi:hypothetical protein